MNLRWTLPVVTLIACGGSPSPVPSPTPAPAPTHTGYVPDAGPDANRDYTEALLCMEDCEMTEEGDYDTTEALCRERCGMPPRP